MSKFFSEQNALNFYLQLKLVYFKHKVITNTKLEYKLLYTK